jgi:hypothetical protein
MRRTEQSPRQISRLAHPMSRLDTGGAIADSCSILPKIFVQWDGSWGGRGMLGPPTGLVIALLLGISVEDSQIMRVQFCTRFVLPNVQSFKCDQGSSHWRFSVPVIKEFDALAHLIAPHSISIQPDGSDTEPTRNLSSCRSKRSPIVTNDESDRRHPRRCF